MLTIVLMSITLCNVSYMVTHGHERVYYEGGSQPYGEEVCPCLYPHIAWFIARLLTAPKSPGPTMPGWRPGSHRMSSIMNICQTLMDSATRGRVCHIPMCGSTAIVTTAIGPASGA